MFRRRVVELACAIAATGCGRVGFALLTDGAPPADAVTSSDSATTDAPGAIANVGNSVQGTNMNTGAEVVLQPAPTGANHLLVIGVSYCCAGSTPPSILDDRGSLWQSAGSAIPDGAGDYVAIFDAVASGGGVTAITFGNTQHYVSAIFSEYANVDLDAPLDGYTGQAVTSSLGDSGPLTPTSPGDLLVVVGDDDRDTTTAAAGSGFTLIAPGFYATTTTQQGIAMAYQIDGDTAVVHGTLQWQVSYVLPVAMAAFRRAM